MNSNRLIFFARLGLALLLLLALSACGGGGGKTTPAGNQGDGTGQPAGSPAARSISLSLSNTTPSAGLLDSRLMVSGADTLHQLSARVAYDPRAVRPLEVQRGGLVDSRAIFFSGENKAAARAAAYVPVAFTYHAGELIPGASGSIAELRFEVLDPALDPGIRLIQSEEFLLAYDRDKQPLKVEVEVAR